MENTFGKKAADDDGPDPDDMIDRDMQRPQFVSWSARRESNILLKILGAQYPDREDLIAKVDRAHELLTEVDDALDLAIAQSD